jgi:glutathione synthase/RimK-type ligase-like ATP-grasp enzyme
MQVLILPHIENFNLAEESFKDVDFDKTFFKNLRYIFGDTGAYVRYQNKDCKDYDLVWLSSHWGTRDLAYALDIYLDSKKTKHTAVERAGSKVTDHMKFSLSNINTPKTYYINTKKIEPYIEEIEVHCGYPMVVKDIKGCRGRNTFLVHNREELNDTVASLNPETKVLYQEYIPNEYDWGVLISGGKVVAAEKSYPSEGEFRNNACNGAREEFVDLSECPEEIQWMAIDSAKSLGLDWCRADIVVHEDTNKPYLLEINRYPGITKGTDEVEAVKKYITSMVN